jgi:hypothetical protein
MYFVALVDRTTGEIVSTSIDVCDDITEAEAIYVETVEHMCDNRFYAPYDALMGVISSD